MFEPSAPITALLEAVALRPSATAGMQAMLQRAQEFPTPTQAKLAGLALDPAGRAAADEALDGYWSDAQRQRVMLAFAGTDREVIIGSGLHAAVYAAGRVLNGYPKPLILERGPRIGGTFATTTRPAFHLNSRNRPGGPGLAGDLGASLNYLPGAPIQAANASMAEYQTNTDLAFIIRLTLAQYADILPDARVLSVTADDIGVQVETLDRGVLRAARVIDARGVGDPTDQDIADGVTILTFPQFMRRMDGMWPLRGLRRVAVIGGGDSGKCTVESFLGLAPQPWMAAAALDHIDRIDWYAALPDTCADWQAEIRGRYQPIGRFLRPDRYSVRRLNVVNRRPRPIALPGAAVVDGRTYDLAVMCTGNTETDIDGLDLNDFDMWNALDGTPAARKAYGRPIFRVGPHAQLPITVREHADGVADITANSVAIFRTATKTAALAATLGRPTAG